MLTKPRMRKISNEKRQFMLKLRLQVFELCKIFKAVIKMLQQGILNTFEINKNRISQEINSLFKGIEDLKKN